MHLTSEQAYWEAVVRRDSQADGHFYFAVQTTGVYCRPSCSAKRARRENVQFYATADEAERAGFRPCKRCRPKDLSMQANASAVIASICRQLDGAEKMPKLSELAARAGLSPFHFHRIFHKQTGLTPKQYFAAQRANRMREHLSKSGSVTDAVYAAGFSSSSRFYERSTEILGMRPKAFQAGGAGEQIRFALGACSLGDILVAATEKGVCAISLGDDPQRLLREFQDSFPNATLLGANEEFEAYVAKVVAFVDSPRDHLDLPLDVRGTAFQQRVWKALQAIPLGATVTYSDLAKTIGDRKATRAVARACATNPVALAIPCHRVIRTDGGLAGYRWGVERKRQLLTNESAI